MAQFCPQCGSPQDASGHCPQCAPAITGATPTAAYTPFATAAAPLPFYAAPPASRFSGQWNWGAFFLCPLWLMNHGQVPLGIGVLLVGFVPFLGGIVSLTAAIYYGIKGNDIAMRYRVFTDEAQFVAVQNAWRNWGFGLFALGILLAIGAIVLSVVMAAVAGHAAGSS
jgi:hypothetical protein